MSEFKFSCPGCGQHIKCGPEYGGLQINCPACGNAMTVPRAAGATPPARPTAKSGSRGLLIGGIALAVVGAGLGACFYFGVFSKAPETAKDGPVAKPVGGKRDKAMAKEAATPAKSPSARAKDFYAGLTNYSAKGKMVTVVDMSKVDMSGMPGMSGNSAQAKAAREAATKPQTITSEFTIKLGRPGYYRLEWTQKAGPAVMKGAVWSAGEGDFAMIMGNQYSKYDSKDKPLKLAGQSVGVLPAVFFDLAEDGEKPFDKLTDSGDGKLDGADCHILTGTEKGVKIKVWISKQDSQIRKAEMVVGDIEVSDEEIIAQIKAKGQKPTPKLIADAKKSVAQFSNMHATITMTYDHLEANTGISEADFKYTPPADAKLVPAMF